MIVYRAVSEIEISNLIGLNNRRYSPKGKNTFNYLKNIDYKHFFYFYDCAVSFMEEQNYNRAYDKYAMIFAYDIKSDILKKYFGFGNYNMKAVKNKDPLMKYFDEVYFPEFAIPSILIKKNMIVGIGNKNRLTPVNDNYDNNLYRKVLDNQKQFLNY